MNDPLGKAILSYAEHPSKRKNIIVHSETMEDDVIPVHYLFRSYKDFPTIEKMAVASSFGQILDVGAGAGVHSKHLLDKQLNVKAIDLSPGAVEYMLQQNIPARNINFFDLQNEKYDTILMMMNGLGICGELGNLKRLLEKAYQLLEKEGCLLADSTDVHYLYEEEDGSVWMDLHSNYYGNFDFQMEFEGEKGNWFKWLYVDFETLKLTAQAVGFEVELLLEENHQYLVKLKK